MRKVFLLAAFITLVFSTHAHQVPDTLHILSDLLKSVKNEYAPDKRTEVFNYSIVGQQAAKVYVETSSKESLLVLQNRLKVAGLRADLYPVLLPAPDLGLESEGLITLSVSNNRSAPAHSAELASQSLLGTPIQLLKKEGGFYLCRTPDGYISWIDNAAIHRTTAKGIAHWQQADKVIYKKEFGHSYKEPSMSSNYVSDLTAGNILRLIAFKGKFCEVLYPSGVRAFVPSKEVIRYSSWIKPQLPSADDIIRTAYRFLGTPYLWGGTSAKGLDCSGFTKICFFLNRIQLERDASQQALNGEFVDVAGGNDIGKALKNLKKGDLLFFAAGKNKGNMHITHTAIYIDKGKFIQSAGLVKISSLLKSDPEYDDFATGTLVSSRRILTALGSKGIQVLGAELKQ